VLLFSDSFVSMFKTVDLVIFVVTTVDVELEFSEEMSEEVVVE
jgi:hypothetical protein